jgi:hypothetical protein
MSFPQSNPDFLQRKIHMDIILRSLDEINKLKTGYPRPYGYEQKINDYYGQIRKRLNQWNEVNYSSPSLPTKLEILELYVNPNYNTYTQLYDIYVNNYLDKASDHPIKQIFQTALQTMTDVLKSNRPPFTKYSLDINTRGQQNRRYTDFPWNNPRAKLPPIEDILFEGGFTSDQFRSQVEQSIRSSGYRSFFAPAPPSIITPKNLSELPLTQTRSGDFQANPIINVVGNTSSRIPPDHNYIQKYLKYKNKYLNLKEKNDSLQK